MHPTTGRKLFGGSRGIKTKSIPIAALDWSVDVWPHPPHMEAASPLLFSNRQPCRTVGPFPFYLLNVGDLLAFLKAVLKIR